MMASAQEVAEEYESGNRDHGQDVKMGGSGKSRTKAEQAEHKHTHPEGDTRKIVDNARHGEERRRDDEIKKQTGGAK